MACHNLRGTLGTLGAAGMLPQLADFETALRQPIPAASLATQAAALNRQLVALVATLSQAVDA
jgi:hypothetical protein